MTPPRGFKADAERRAAQLRKQIGLQPAEPVAIDQIAELLAITIVDAADLVDRERLEELEALQAFSFSAATFHVSDRTVIVTNPLRTSGRRSSDVAHELGHILLHHELTEIRYLDGIPFRTCLPEQEEQATVLGGTLLLPRELLLVAARRGITPEQIAAENNVTPEMARFRYNTTGVSKQSGRRSG